MSTISTGVGLISGLNITDLVDSLMAIQQRPLTLLQQRATELVSRRTAWMQISAQLLSIQNIANRLSSADAFRRTSATSSSESTLLATAGAGANPGQYTFTVRQLAARHQLISSGFATRDRTPVGAGTISIEGMAGRVDRSTTLDALNGGAGVRAGKIRITDRAGGSAEIDLRGAVTVDDVLSAINSQTTVAVSASVDGDSLVLRDETGLTTGLLAVVEVGGGQTASDLGLLIAEADGVITGRALVTLSAETRLTDLNDGNGVRVLSGLGDFRLTLADGTLLDYDLSGRLSQVNRDNGDGTFTDLSTPLSVLNHGAGVPAGRIRVTNRAGVQTEIDLSTARTIRDVVIDGQWAAAGLSVTISGSHLAVTDSSTGTGALSIEDLDSTTASALGLTEAASGSTLTGDDVYFVDTIGDVIRVINAHADNDDGAGGKKLLAELSTDRPGLTLTDATGGGGALAIEALNGSNAAADLGLLGGVSGNSIASRRLLGGLNTVLLRSLNGGQGVTAPGSIQLTDRSGATVTVDLSAAQTLADVISAINAAAIGVTASVSSSGLGIELVDTSGGAGSLVVADLEGSTTAADLNIAFSGPANVVASGNLQRQYVSSALLLADYHGTGVPAGKFRITNSLGVSAVVDLTQGNEATLQDVIDEVNSRGIGVTARVNDTGDGLLLEDSNGGGGRLKVTEEGGGVAKALGILGEAAEGATVIDGSFEKQVVVTAGDTLDSVLRKLQSSGAPLSATLINDGASSRPYRLSLMSNATGRDGALAIDVGTTGLSFSTLTRARDALVFFGSPDAEAPLILHSATNTLSEAIPGVRLDLVGTSDQPVTVTVEQNVKAIADDLSSFVAAFNNAMSQIDGLTKYDSESQTRSVLTSDPTVLRVRQRLLNVVLRSVEGQPAALDRLSRVGITLTSGASLKFDESVFRRALEDNPEGVVELFTHTTTDEDGNSVVTGIAGLIKTELERLTKDETGVISIQRNSIQSSEKLVSDRITQLQTLLTRRRESLLSQFYTMEETLARLQSQQSALSSLVTLQYTGSGYTTKSS